MRRKNEKSDPRVMSGESQLTERGIRGAANKEEEKRDAKRPRQSNGSRQTIGAERT